jgi:hypothetical protein
MIQTAWWGEGLSISGDLAVGPGREPTVVIGSAGEPEISAGFDRESSATRVDRAMCGEMSAYVNLARHAVRCAGQRWRQSVA